MGVESGMPLGSVEVEVKANLDQLTKGFAKGRRETQKFSNDMVTVNRYAQQMAAGQEKAAAAAAAMRVQQLATAKAINDVTRATNPAVASTRLVSSAVRDAEKAYMAGSISAGALARAQAIGHPWMVKTAGASDKVTAAVGRQGAGFLQTARSARFLISALGISFVGAMGRSVVATAEATAAIADQAREVGLNSRQLQEYRGMAKDVGLSTDEMDGALKAFNHTVDEAATKNPQAVKLFKLLGVSLKDARGEAKDTNTLFLETIDRLGQVGNKAERAAGQAAAFGEAYGPKMGRLVDQGSEGIERLRKAVEDTGIVLSDEQIQKADVTAKKLDEVREVLSAKYASAVVENAEAIGTLADAFQYLSEKAIKGASDYIKGIENIKKNGFPIGFGLLGHIGGTGPDSKSTVTVKLPPLPAAKPKGPNISLAGLNAPKGGHGRQAPENQFEREELREQEEHLKLLRDQTGNLHEINEIDRQLIDINLKERFEQLDQMVHRKALTAAQAKKLKGEAADNAALEKEAVDRKMREGMIEQSNRTADEMAQLEQDGLEAALRMSRTDDERQKIEMLILDSKQQQAVAEIDKQIALAREAHDENRIADLTEERKKLLENQSKEIKAFDLEHLTGIAKFKNDLPKTDAEFAQAIKDLKFDLFNEKLQQAAGFAGDIGSAFGRAAGALARFENPLTVLQGLLGDLAETMTRNFIEKPVTDWATRKIGMPLAKQGFGKDLTKLSGPDPITVQEMNVALGLATQDLQMLAAAAAQASGALGNQTAVGAATSAEALAGSATEATGALNEQTPAIGQFGGALTQLISSLSGGGGGSGLFGSLLNIGMSALGSFGGAAGGGNPLGSFAPGAAGSYPLLGFAGGGFTGSGADHEIAGKVHKNEWVWDADTTRRFRPLLEMISSGRVPSFAGGGQGQGPHQRKPDLHLHLGAMSFPGVRDSRSARRAGKQVLSVVSRGLAEVSRTGLNRGQMR